MVWLDAIVPARGGATVASAGHRARIAPLVSDGRVAEWTTWWGPAAWARLVPVPGHRPESGAEYVQLSDAYDGDAAIARARGWPVGGRRDGAHLDVATDPAGVLALIG